MIIRSARSPRHIQGGCFALSLLAASGPACAASEKVLYSFNGGSDGVEPLAGLINVGGTLYGTTAAGGELDGCTYGCGTVFKVTTAGAETVLHSFGTGSDGANPMAGLINAGARVLYGTTQAGGASNKGTVFKVTTAGAETVLHSFGIGSDGSNATAGLIKVGGALYGTIQFGGGSANCGPNGCGTVFAVTP